jgi:tripartite-type tricarboxylate transporter receptor subunit TctC
MKFQSKASLFFLFGLVFLVAPAVAAEKAFYQGKTITFLINFSAGGPTDIEGRIVARYLARHIPGNPLIVV